MSDFAKGDVVLLKSGGPRMTIQEVGDYGFSDAPLNGAHCVWFEKNKSFEKPFSFDVLVKFKIAGPMVF